MTIGRSSKVEALDDHRQVTDNGGGGGPTDLPSRVAILETEFRHLATKRDLDNAANGIKIWILLGILAGMIVAGGFGVGIAEVLFSTDASSTVP